MPPAVIGLLLASAILHAAWNILLKTSGDPLRTAGRGMIVAGVVLVPSAVLGWWVVGQPAIPPEAWVLAVASGGLEAIYFVLLSAAYRRGDLSLVYPIARGTAPVLAVLIGVGVLGERLGPQGSVGVVCLLVGILVLQRPWAVLRRSSELSRPVREATWLAVAVGVVIAAYSAVDRNGARLVPPWLYAAMFWTFMTLFLGMWIAAADRGLWRSRVPSAEPRSEPHSELGWGRAAAGGLMTLATYLLVLVAYVFAPLSAVAPLRESAIVIVSGWGTLRLGEAVGLRNGLPRLGAALLIVLGAVLLAEPR